MTEDNLYQEVAQFFITSSIPHIDSVTKRVNDDRVGFIYAECERRFRVFNRELTSILCRLDELGVISVVENDDTDFPEVTFNTFQ